VDLRKFFDAVEKGNISVVKQSLEIHPEWIHEEYYIFLYGNIHQKCLGYKKFSF
jgi:hypothetical protein